jgi:hypothetical protein
MRDPIDVIVHDQNVWTGWHKNAASNRVDCWTLERDGKLTLFQVGIVTHDNGKTYRLHGEYRWRGQLYHQAAGGIIGVPEHAKWGSLEGGSSNRTQIFRHPEFVVLFKDVELSPRNVSDAELDPPVPKASGRGFAVVDWFITFAGQTGQGIVKFQNGKPAWVHGIDVSGFDPKSFEPPLWRGDIISFDQAVEKWGAKQGGPPKLTGVKLVNREW